MIPAIKETSAPYYIDRNEAKEDSYITARHDLSYWRESSPWSENGPYSIEHIKKEQQLKGWMLQFV